MPFCGKCGGSINEGAGFCPSCGAPAGGQPAQQSWQDINNTADTTAEYDPADIEANKIFAALSYLGILVIVPFLAAPNSKFARFHANQGLTLFLLIIAYSILSFILNVIFTAINLWVLVILITLLIFALSIPLIVLIILGLMNAIQGKAKELPFIGKIKIIK